MSTRQGPGRPRRLLVPALLVLLGVAIGLGAAYVRPPLRGPAGPILSALPGEPMDLEVADGVGYASLFDSVVGITVRGDRVTWTAAQNVDGLSHPRGMALTDDTLFVVDIPIMPCVSEAGCPEDPLERELASIAASNARIVALSIQPDGTLSEPRTILDELPVVGRDHSANDLEIGPDGMLYLAVGNIDQLWSDPGRLAEVSHPHLDWLGTILRIDPGSGEASIWASGLRNVYGLTFSPDGRLFGVDNDGQTLRSWREEELIELKRGANYGYPFDGSFGPYRARTAFPIFALEPGGHAGIAWVGDGVVTGSCGRLDRVPFINRHGELEVRNRVDIDVLARPNGCVTSVVPVDGGLLVAAFGASGIYFVPAP